MIAISQKHWTGDVAELLRVGEGFVLDDVDPESRPGTTTSKKHAAEDLASGAEAARRATRSACTRRAASDATDASVLLVLQAMDSAGKGGIIRHVVGSVDPQGVSITAFKKPTDEELAHDFLWRVEQRLPEPGIIGVFDRSHYEDVLIGRVRELAPPDEIERRYGAINDFEKRLTDAGTRIVKVMLHISRDEQKERLMERLERPDKHWKYNPGDVDERAAVAAVHGGVPDRVRAHLDRARAVVRRAREPQVVRPASPCSTCCSRRSKRSTRSGRRRPYDVEVEKARLAAT